MLTRNQMEHVIKDGGSILHGGHVITRLEDLPTDADLAVGDPEQEARAAAGLEAQIAALQAQHARLTGARMVRTGAQPNESTNAVLAGPEGVPDVRPAPESKESPAVKRGR